MLLLAAGCGGPKKDEGFLNLILQPVPNTHPFDPPSKTLYLEVDDDVGTLLDARSFDIASGAFTLDHTPVGGTRIFHVRIDDDSDVPIWQGASGPIDIETGVHQSVTIDLEAVP